MRREREGYSLVEIIMVALLLAVVVAFATRGIQYVSKTLSMQERLEWATRLRNASYLLSKDLSLASEILSPAVPSQDFQSSLVFKNQRNEVVGIFLSPEGLVQFNYNTDMARTIFPFAASFSCRLAQENLLEFTLVVKKEKIDFSVRNQLSMYQTLP